MSDIIRREVIYLWYYFSIQFRQIFWYWVFGMALGSAVSVFGKGKIYGIMESLRNRKMGVLGLIPASFWGLLLHCVCMGQSL